MTQESEINFYLTKVLELNKACLTTQESDFSNSYLMKFTQHSEPQKAIFVIFNIQFKSFSPQYNVCTDTREYIFIFVFFSLLIAKSVLTSKDVPCTS